MEAAIRTSIPNHITDVQGIDEDGSDGGLRPFATVDGRPLRITCGRLALLVEGMGDRLESLALCNIHLEEVLDYLHPLWIAERQLGMISLGDGQGFSLFEGADECPSFVQHLL